MVLEEAEEFIFSATTEFLELGLEVFTGRLERGGGQLDQVGAERELQVRGQRRRGEQAAVPERGRVLAEGGPLVGLQGQPGGAREPGLGGLVCGAGALLDGDAGQRGRLHLQGEAGKPVHSAVQLPVGRAGGGGGRQVGGASAEGAGRVAGRRAARGAPAGLPPARCVTTHCIKSRGMPSRGCLGICIQRIAGTALPAYGLR